MIPFAEWRPDAYELNAAVAAVAKGVLPGATAYRPWPQLTPYSTAVGAAVRGAFAARRTDGAYVVYAGTETALYLFSGPTSAWTNVSGAAYALPNDESWSFDQFGSTLIACNANTGPQALNIDAGTAAANLAGSPPPARHVRIVGDQVWLGGLTDNPNGVIWSGRNDHTWWTLGQRDCDQNIFPEGGFVTGLTALETGLVFQETSIRRFSAENSKAIYNFGRLEDNRGLIAPDSLVVRGRVAYYLSQEGFMATDPTGATLQIGFEAVDKWFQDNSNSSRLYAIKAAADPLRARIFWLFPSINNLSTTLDLMLCYDIALQRWSYADISATSILPAATPGLSLEALDSLGYTLDSLPFTLDSRQFQGGAPLLAAFDGNQKLGFFTGSNMAATLETAEFQPIPGRRSLIRGVIPYTDSPDATIQIGTRERLQDTRMWGGTSAINVQGICPARASGRFMRVRASLPASAAWNNVQGVDVDAVPEGLR